MKEEGLFQIIDYDKFPELVRLWDEWNDKTAFMSTGNCQTKEWDDLVAYGKEHIKEVAEFIYDMFENGLEVNWPEMTLYDKCLGQPLLSTEDGGYVNPAWESAQNAYKLICGMHCGRIKGGEVILDDIKNQ